MPSHCDFGAWADTVFRAPITPTAINPASASDATVNFIGNLTLYKGPKDEPLLPIS